MLTTIEPTTPAPLDLRTLALQEQADAYAVHAHGKGTQRAYASAWAIYTDWCGSIDRNPLDGDPETLALYVADRAATLSVSTIGVHVAAVREAHRLAGVSLDMSAARLRMVLGGVRRVLGVAPQRQAAAVTPDVLRRMLATRKPASHAAGARDRAMLLIGFGGAFRRSELVALTVGDVEHVAGRGLRVTVRRSKTDQVGEGKRISICANPADPNFCPAVAFARWMEHRRKASDCGTLDRPLFCAVRHGSLSAEPLIDQTVDRLIKACAAEAGLEAASSYSGHSLRRGFMTTAAEAGADLPAMMRQSRHKSVGEALKYIDEANAWTGNASQGVWR